MRKKARFGVTMVAALAFIGVACSHGQSAPAARGPVAVGARAPQFTLPSAGGGDVSLAGFSGKPVLLYFSMGPG
jgi:cytochrome oxidase Cu insertion factor (SCO1/SenC/PrrC family)